MPELTSKVAERIADRVIDEHRTLAVRWLDRLRHLVLVKPNDIFPSPTLLDHIPELLARVGKSIGASDREDIAADSAVVMKAQELGALRHTQHASVHQILQEYDLLGGVLATFVKEEIQRLGLRPSPDECFDIASRVSRAIAVSGGRPLRPSSVITPTRSRRRRSSSKVSTGCSATNCASRLGWSTPPHT